MTKIIYPQTFVHVSNNDVKPRNVLISDDNEVVWEHKIRAGTYRNIEEIIREINDVTAFSEHYRLTRLVGNHVMLVKVCIATTCEAKLHKVAFGSSLRKILGFEKKSHLNVGRAQCLSILNVCRNV